MGVRRVLKVGGRLAMAGVFIKGGWDAFREPGHRGKMAATVGLPESDLLVRANAVAMMTGGAALATGILPRAAATGLIASMTAVTVAGHPFWKEQEPAVRNRQLGQFLKNLGLIGGLLIYLSRD
jgi:putative oxidoreductase